MSTECWKIDNNLCRCCHSQGVFKTMGMPCYDRGHGEIFSEMLQETFDISMTPVPGPLCMVTYTICEVCMMKLRDATSFKKQVLKCEELFRELYRNNSIKVEKDVKLECDVIYPEDLKEEEGQYQEDTAMDNQNDDADAEINTVDDDSDDEPLKLKEEINETKPGNKVKVKATIKSKCKKPSKSVRTKKEDVSSVVKKRKSPKPRKKKGRSEGNRVAKNAKRKECNKTVDNRKIVPNNSKTRRKFFCVPLDKFKQEGDTFVCLTCKKLCNKRMSMINHIRREHLNMIPVGTHKCKYCDQRFPTKVVFIKHALKDHGVDQRWHCKACDMKFFAHIGLKVHMISYHKLGGTLLKCQFCDYETYFVPYLKKHMETHEPAERHQCNFCKKTFAKRRGMILHEKIHTGDKSKVCKLCEKAFVQKASLNYHMAKYHPEFNF